MTNTSSEPTATFGIGEPIRTGENSKYMPSGHHHSDGHVVMFLDPDTVVSIMPWGECRVRYKGRRAL